MKINNCRELWAAWMSEPSWVEEETEEKALALLEKWVFKGTECGCVFGTMLTTDQSADPEGIYVGGYAEGSDAELPIYTLAYPFTLEEWTEALDQADADGVEEWKRANNQNLARLIDEKEKEIENRYKQNLARLIDEKEKEIENMYKDFGGEG